MSQNTSTKDFRTKAYVLRRTNYGEADRILNLITPLGKISAIAKGVRKEKSKLAGGVEMFCLIDVNIYQGKNDFGLITSAKMLNSYFNLLIDSPRLELASLILKKVSLAAENSNSPDFFEIVNQTIPALNSQVNLELVEAWFWFNLTRACGEEANLYRDTTGAKLDQDTQYVWDVQEAALHAQPGGNIGANEIKIMRLMLTSPLSVLTRIKNISAMLPSVLYIAKAVSKN